MNSFEISIEEGNPANLVAFEVHLHTSPPEVKEKTINISKYMPVNERVKQIHLRDAVFDEGVMNIYSCMFETGKCQLHFYGLLRGKEHRSKVDLKQTNQRDYDLLNDRIKLILNKSKNILKSYYKDAKIKNIEHMIIAFLSDE